MRRRMGGTLNGSIDDSNMDKEERMRFAMRACHDHRGLMRKVTECVLSAKIAPPGRLERTQHEAVLIELKFNVWYYVGDQRMAFTLIRDNKCVAYFPPRPYNGHIAGSPFYTEVPLQQLATRVHEDTADMTVFDSVVRTESRLDVAWSSALAAEKTAGFWHDAREEFIEKTWAPDRHADWCLAHDERRDLGFV